MNEPSLTAQQLPLAFETSEARAVRQLLKDALDARTPDQLVAFIEFSQSFRRLSVWNARMAYIQRPGASIIASEYEWRGKGREVAPDAVPIIILWPFGPIRFVYELEDTLPKVLRAEIGDPFATKGSLKKGTVGRLRTALKKQNSFQIHVEERRLGHDRAGSAASHGSLKVGDLASETLGAFAGSRASSSLEKHATVPVYRVQINDRMTEAEQFVTLGHELGHIFCGHLGPCQGRSGREEESGWPDRRKLPANQAEIEAEAVAYLVASRAGLVTGSAQYLKSYAAETKVEEIDIDLVVRAAARIERLGKISHGRMEFDRKPVASSQEAPTP